MKVKSLLASLALSAVMLTATLPTHAVSSSFSDIQDSSTAVNADILRLMGVVSGSGDNLFTPNDNLTRAQFCVMVVNMMGLGSQVPVHNTRTIFRDVTARHWARGFINLAASTTVGAAADGSGSRLISGVGNGMFQPDTQITYAQAITILLRVLGYGEDQVGGVWPTSYLTFADSLNLSENLLLSPHVPLTRAQAAQLFVNLLSTDTVNESPYYATLGSTISDVILLEFDVQADDQTPGAIRTSAGTYLPAVEDVIPTALQGRRGTLVLDENKKIAAFVPDTTSSVTLTLSAPAEATYLLGSDGTRYTISADTPAFDRSQDNASDNTYSNIWVNLRAGSQVTLFLEHGKVISVHYAASTKPAESALIASDILTRDALTLLANGSTTAVIQKNGQPISFEAIQPYDVITYDKTSDVLLVSDLRLTCVYESASPNPTTPTSIHALGHDFPVLDSALDTASQFSVGDSVTLLLTTDGQVAGFAEPSSALRSNAFGMADRSTVNMVLPTGNVIELKSTKQLDDYLLKQVVLVSSESAGIMNARVIPKRAAASDFDVANMTLSSYRVTPNVAIYERTNESICVPISLSSLELTTIPGKQIHTYRLNSSNMVDIIVLNAATGSSYDYGRYLVKRLSSEEAGANGSTIATYFDSPQTGMIQLPDASFIGTEETFIGIALDGNNDLRAQIKLTALKGVSRSDFSVADDGSATVNVNGMIYPVASDLQAFNHDTERWFSGDDILGQVRAYSDTMTLYADPMTHHIRIISTK